jgi:hypothetical protein
MLAVVELPLSISRGRVLIYGLAIFIAGLYQLVLEDIFAPNRGDWSFFWSGGANVGTTSLMNPALFCGFQSAHGFSCDPWIYPPAAALIFWPFSLLPFHASYIVALVVLSAFALIAGALLADAFEVPRWLGILLAVAWTPIKLSVINGQNETLALLLVTLAIVAAKGNRKVLLGLAVGAMLYKPTIGLPFLVLLLLRKEWSALSIAALCGLCWYLVSVAASAGQWAWPLHYPALLHSTANAEFLRNAAKSTDLPDILMQLGVVAPVAIGAGVALFLVAIPRLMRESLVSSLAITSLLSVVTRPHAWHYAPAIVLPVIFYVMRSFQEPARTWIIAAAYVVSCISVISIPGMTSWNLEGLVVLALTAIVLLPGGFTRVWPVRAEARSNVPEHQRPS